eukprot:12191967-Alexandrium_andersonii.AAC.1
MRHRLVRALQFDPSSGFGGMRTAQQQQMCAHVHEGGRLPVVVGQHGACARCPRELIPAGARHGASTRHDCPMTQPAPRPAPVSYTHLTLPTICSV